jgi:hypothetical protein
VSGAGAVWLGLWPFATSQTIRTYLLYQMLVSDAAGERIGRTSEDTVYVAWLEHLAKIEAVQTAGLVELRCDIPRCRNFPRGSGNGLRLMWHSHDYLSPRLVGRLRGGQPGIQCRCKAQVKPHSRQCDCLHRVKGIFATKISKRPSAERYRR